MRKIAFLLSFLVCATAALAWPYVPGIYGNTAAPPVTTCPNGLSYVSYDGCLGANLGAQFVDATMLADYAKDGSGSVLTVNHIGPFNKAGIDFPVGTITQTYTDPRLGSVIGVAVLSGTTLSYVSISNGGVPKAGMTVWDAPSGGHAYYSDGPKIVSCTGSSPTYVCTVDKSETAHGGFTAYASVWPGCVDNLGTSTTNDSITCPFLGSANNFTATFDHIEFGATGGHNGTVLSATSKSDFSTTGHVVLTNNHIAIDQYSNGNNVIAVGGTANPNISLFADGNDCDGGNAGTPLLGPWTFSAASSCINWASQGTALVHNSITVKNLYIHEWAANPLNFQLGYVDIYEQSLVYYRVNLNCGNAGGNVCHGAPTQYGTTLTGSSGSVKMYNITLVYPYGFQNGAITAGLAVLGGINSAVTEDIDIEGATIISNVSNNPGHATMSVLVDPFRIGKISNFIAKHIYVNGVGTASCFNAGGDLQNPSSVANASMTPNVGSGTSVWSWSGFSGQVPIPFPGQTVVLGNPSSAVQFQASESDNGNGTSTLTITGTPPGTMTTATQIVALRLLDIIAHPTLIVSGSGSSYIVTNNSGSGETRTSQKFNVAQSIMPFGSGGTTATGGMTTAGYNGTWLVGGERTQASTNTWAALSAGIGNVATIDTDISDNWEMGTAGAGGAIILDGINLTGGTCPAALPA